ncbi:MULTISPECIES: sugar phosphate isomerase/epimerase [unclassified Curtobacterium]|uniref:sugar phosphate isomerase/epimerase family protein n=2 Tax=Curtobacterium TaxID=2034 RepID=UPI0021BF25BE|nr:sugar phosphate isomerase/epimerase family protein [Curtobacterium sp. C2H10]MCT9619849.1 sugar phosphate isomerase/epimerase [Curtobacterium sp. C2H10]
MSFTGFGVVAGAALTEAVRRAGADHVEPTIAGNLAIRPNGDGGGHDHGGGWVLDDGYAGDRFPSFAILVPGDLPLLTADPDAVRDYFEAVLPIVHSVAEPGAKIVFGSGTARTAPDGMPETEAHRRFAEVLRTARDTAAANDLRIVLEPLSRSETNVLHSVAEAVRFLDDTAVDGVDVVADLFHIRNEGESLDVLREHGARIGHVHVSDRDRRPLGADGGDDVWRDFLAAVHDGGYRGSVSLECNWSPDTATAEQEIGRSLELLRRTGAMLVA